MAPCAVLGIGAGVVVGEGADANGLLGAPPPPPRATCCSSLRTRPSI